MKYAVYHRNKRSVELDLHDEHGREVLLGLLETADVFVETWRPGVAKRLGLGYEAVHERCPERWSTAPSQDSDRVATLPTCRATRRSCMRRQA